MQKALELLSEFVKWYEEVSGDDISGYDQDTTPYAVWEFLTHTISVDNPGPART